jgi:Na+:H+ antiporter, NhaA family
MLLSWEPAHFRAALMYRQQPEAHRTMADHVPTDPAPRKRDDRGRGHSVAGYLKAIVNNSATPGVVLIICTALALAAANSGLADHYRSLFHTKLGIGIGSMTLSMELHHWINDGLMAIFFFAIGLEIKRELLIGQLSSIKRSALPIIGALGGMVVPAAMYAALNYSGPGSRGWGIPMATDIAFALGVLSLLGDRVPSALKVFLLALAIVDDLGAVLVIAIFYTDTIAFTPLLAALGGLLLAVGLNASKVRAPAWYALVGVVVWFCMLRSGVHATIAGVLMGFAIPVKTLYDGPTWLASIEHAIARYRKVLAVHDPESNEELGERQEIVHRIESATEKAQSPLIRLEHGLAPWVAFFIMPVFAFTNAGVAISSDRIGETLASPIAWGVFLGLFLGKQIGVFLFCWLGVKLGVAALPQGTRWKQFYGVAILAGIGFTMSLFVTELSFKGSAELIDLSKIAVLAASLLAGIMGYVWLRALSRRRDEGWYR